MRFLKPSIFYPKEYNEVSINKMKEVEKKYNNYLFQIKEKYNIELFELYTITDRFHDYIITKIEYSYNNISISNQVALFICSHDEEKKCKLFFEDVKEFLFNGITPNLDDITLCEIGITKRFKYIYFHFACGTDLEIKFDNVIIS